MKHGFIWTSLTGATLGPSKATMIGTLLSKNDLKIVHTGPKKRRISEVMSDPFALVVTVRPFAHAVQYFAQHVPHHEGT